MTPQEAINWIRLDIDMTKFDPSTGEEAYLNDEAKKVIEAMEMAIDALLRCSEMPNDSDTISRQAAIDALDCINGTEEVLRSLPSAQPEIIHCKDCRWWDKYGDYDNGYCMAAKHGYYSEHWEINIRRKYRGDFYCADAEPKEEQA